MAADRSSSVGEFRQLFETELDTIDRVVAYVRGRHHLPASEADDFGSFVKLKLIEDDYRVFRQFCGRSSLRTYLTVVIQRLLLDYRVQVWGKWRPSAAARRAGPLGMLLERLIVRDAHTFDEACEILFTNHRVRVSRSELAELAARLPQRVTRRLEPEDALEQVPSNQPSAEDQAMDSDRADQASLVGNLLRDAVGRLPERDRVILRMRFEDGCTAGEIAAAVGGTDRAVYRCVESLLRSLRKAMEQHGLRRQEVSRILQSPYVSPESETFTAAVITSGPSIWQGE
jgi:RNA polymerase sigma factor (sigma-70 family)